MDNIDQILKMIQNGAYEAAPRLACLAVVAIAVRDSLSERSARLSRTERLAKSTLNVLAIAIALCTVISAGIGMYFSYR